LKTGDQVVEFIIAEIEFFDSAQMSLERSSQSDSKISRNEGFRQIEMREGVIVYQKWNSRARIDQKLQFLDDAMPGSDGRIKIRFAFVDGQRDCLKFFIRLEMFFFY